MHLSSLTPLVFFLTSQAYTNELENKVLRLEEENEMLRQQKVSGVFSNVCMRKLTSFSTTATKAVKK